MDTNVQNMDIVLTTVSRRRPRGSIWYHDTGRYRLDNLEVQTENIASEQTVDLHFTTDPVTMGGLVKTMIREIFRSNDSQAIAGFAGSLVAACFKDFREVLETAMTRMIGGVNIIDDSNRATLVFELDQPDTLQTLMYVAQTILIIFKNISQASYEGFLTKRIRALKAVIGLPENERIDLIMPIGKAAMVRSRLGADFGLKKRLLEILLAHRDEESPVGTMSKYICNILDWHEMTNVLFILDTIVSTDSPVLYDLRISPDILRFLDAAKAIHSSSYYVFFRIREKSQFKRGLVERSKFPILSAVAQKIKSQTAITVLNYKGMPSQLPALVELLVAKHNRYMLAVQPDLHRARLQFLGEFNDNDE